MSTSFVVTTAVRFDRASFILVRLKEELLSLQEGRSVDPYGWRVEVPSSVDSFQKTIPKYDQHVGLDC